METSHKTKEKMHSTINIFSTKLTYPRKRILPIANKAESKKRITPSTKSVTPSETRMTPIFRLSEKRFSTTDNILLG